MILQYEGTQYHIQMYCKPTPLQLALNKYAENFVIYISLGIPGNGKGVSLAIYLQAH